ncbi:MAG: heme ABC transporter ATP-binding protein [Bacteroidota bacterium]
MITAKNVSVIKGGKTILKDISFELHSGMICIAVGKNGAGKTTLLEALTKANTINEGKLLWENINYLEISMQEMALKRAVLSQSVNIAFPIRVSELVEMGTYALAGPMRKKEQAEIIASTLEETGLTTMASRYYNTLSGGEQKRALLARCLVQLKCSRQKGKSQFLFLDEPTSSLDIEQQFKLARLLKKLAKKYQIGIFAILHDINLAAFLADEIILLKAGRIIKKGSPDAVLTPKILEKTLDISVIINPHPVYGCPNITMVPLTDETPDEASLVYQKSNLENEKYL